MHRISSGILAIGLLAHVVGGAAAALAEETPGSPATTFLLGQGMQDDGEGHLLAPRAATATEHLSFLFPSTNAGQTSTATCFFLCAVSGSTGLCGSGSGTAQLVSNPSSPFQAENFRLATVTSGSCSGTPVTLPATVNVGQVLIFDAVFTPRSTGQFAGSLVLGLSPSTTDVSFDFLGSTVRTACVASNTTMCLNYGRFAVTATFAASNGQTGSANMVQLTADTGEMWFFDASSVEAEVKVINGCGLGGHYWFFAGGLTNVRVAITVTDTFTGASRTYHNPQGTAFQPIQDTSAFSTCP